VRLVGDSNLPPVNGVEHPIDLSLFLFAQLILIKERLHKLLLCGAAYAALAKNFVDDSLKRKLNGGNWESLRLYHCGNPLRWTSLLFRSRSVGAVISTEFDM